MREKKRKGISDEEFFGFAKSYLSEAFPNPQRDGCLADDQLTLQAERPRETDPAVIKHITSCSPCFRRYTEILADLKRRKAG